MGGAARRLRRNPSLDDKDDVGHAIVIVGIAVDDAILLAIGRDGEIAIPTDEMESCTSLA
ncbi:hypothetical protein [Rhizobium sp. 007]|uniref:hypothetical protein n=1 Tax=Rhizobium sp. 007 TaxID=2785056 RepID=UPI001890504D|nr:hypothetical protein [Rhizobium sp. 007]QPB21167.1 hypothetical protein ISN39_06830 [Rhizobium sp. 007]